jgi:hypothetical protein
VSLIQGLIRTGMRHGWSRGIMEGDRAWTVIGGVALLAYLAGRVLNREPDVIFSHRMAPGESLRITHEPAPD